MSTGRSVVNSRARAILTLVIVMLVALMAALFVMFYNALRPTGLPERAGSGGDMGVVWVRSMYGFGPAQDQQLKSPTSVAAAPNGDIYATDPGRARVMVFRSDGTFKKLLHTGAGGTGPGQFIRPESIDVDPDGNVYIADSWARKVISFDRNGRYIREYAADQQARGVAVDGGKVYMLDVGKVIVFRAEDGKRISSFGTRGPKPGQIDAYQGIAARNGHVFIADSFNKRLQRFTEDGRREWTVPSGAASRSQAGISSTRSDESSSASVPGHRWDLPQDLTFDAAGRLIVIDAFQFEIAVVDPETGKALKTYGEFGSVDGEFYYPTSVDYDARRDWLVVADTENNRVQILRVPGTGRGAAAALWRATASPFRYLAIPALLLVIALAIVIWSARRVLVKDRRRPDSADGIHRDEISAD